MRVEHDRPGRVNCTGSLQSEMPKSGKRMEKSKFQVMSVKTWPGSLLMKWLAHEVAVSELSIVVPGSRSEYSTEFTTGIKKVDESYKAGCALRSRDHQLSLSTYEAVRKTKQPALPCR